MVTIQTELIALNISCAMVANRPLTHAQKVWYGTRNKDSVVGLTRLNARMASDLGQK